MNRYLFLYLLLLIPFKNLLSQDFSYEKSGFTILKQEIVEEKGEFKNVKMAVKIRGAYDLFTTRRYLCSFLLDMVKTYRKVSQNPCFNSGHLDLTLYFNDDLHLFKPEEYIASIHLVGRKISYLKYSEDKKDLEIVHEETFTQAKQIIESIYGEVWK